MATQREQSLYDSLVFTFKHQAEAFGANEGPGWAATMAKMASVDTFVAALKTAGVTIPDEGTDTSYVSAVVDALTEPAGPGTAEASGAVPGYTASDWSPFSGEVPPAAVSNALTAEEWEVAEKIHEGGHSLKEKVLLAQQWELANEAGEARRQQVAAVAARDSDPQYQADSMVRRFANVQHQLDAADLARQAYAAGAIEQDGSRWKLSGRAVGLLEPQVADRVAAVAARLRPASGNNLGAAGGFAIAEGQESVSLAPAANGAAA